MNFYAFVEFMPRRRFGPHFATRQGTGGKVEDVANVGDECSSKLVEIDAKGRMNLSRKRRAAKPLILNRGACSKVTNMPLSLYPDGRMGFQLVRRSSMGFFNSIKKQNYWPL